VKIDSSSDESESEEEEKAVQPTLQVKAGQDSCLLLVRNLPKDVTGSQIAIELFAEYPTQQVSIHVDESGNSLGSADVVLSRKHAHECVKNLVDVEYRGKEIFLSLVGTTNKVIETRSDAVVKKKKRKKKKKKSTSEKTIPTTAPVAETTLLDLTEPTLKEPKIEKNLQDESHEDEVEEEEANKGKEPIPNQQIGLLLKSNGCVVPETRPWNWNKNTIWNAPQTPEEYVPPDSSPDPEVSFHVTLKSTEFII